MYNLPPVMCIKNSHFLLVCLPILSLFHQRNLSYPELSMYPCVIPSINLSLYLRISDSPCHHCAILFHCICDFSSSMFFHIANMMSMCIYVSLASGSSSPHLCLPVPPSLHLSHSVSLPCCIFCRSMFLSLWRSVYLPLTAHLPISQYSITQYPCQQTLCVSFSLLFAVSLWSSCCLVSLYPASVSLSVYVSVTRHSVSQYHWHTTKSRHRSFSPTLRTSISPYFNPN